MEDLGSVGHLSVACCVMVPKTYQEGNLGYHSLCMVWLMESRMTSATSAMLIRYIGGIVSHLAPKPEKKPSSCQNIFVLKVAPFTLVNIGGHWCKIMALLNPAVGA